PHPYPTGRPSGEQRQRHGDGRAAAYFAFEIDASAVQFNAPADNQQSEAAARNFTHISAAMEGLEKLLEVLLRNPNALIADLKYCLLFSTLDGELNRGSRAGIFHAIGKEVYENMSQQGLVT